MTARADISNARRKKLADRLNRLLAERHEAFLKRHEQRIESERTAWEKGEALPPFYREVLEEGVRRGDVVSREQYNAMDRARFIHEGERYKLEDQLREAEERIERARNALEALGPNPAGSDPVSVALSILAGTEKEGNRGD